MSLLSSTQGTPDRVWSLIATVGQCGGALPRSEVDQWLNPGFVRGNALVQEKPEAVGQTVNPATSLGALVAEGGELRLAHGCPATTEQAFRDWAHDRLVSLNSSEKDAVILETYAWITVNSVQESSLEWVHEWSPKDFVDAAAKAISGGSDDDEGPRINTTKLPSLRRWLEYLGLMTALPTGVRHPTATSRLAREVLRADLPNGSPIDGRDFLSVLASRMPYLDGGRMFQQAAQRTGMATNARQLSPLLTAALHDLHDSGTIALGIHGDASNIIRLAPGHAHKISGFQFVVLRGPEA